jgi:hypothetical protein
MAVAVAAFVGWVVERCIWNRARGFVSNYSSPTAPEPGCLSPVGRPSCRLCARPSRAVSARLATRCTNSPRRQGTETSNVERPTISGFWSGGVFGSERWPIWEVLVAPGFAALLDELLSGSFGMTHGGLCPTMPVIPRAARPGIRLQPAAAPEPGCLCPVGRPSCRLCARPRRAVSARLAIQTNAPRQKGSLIPPGHRRTEWTTDDDEGTDGFISRVLKQRVFPPLSVTNNRKPYCGRKFGCGSDGCWPVVKQPRTGVLINYTQARSKIERGLLSNNAC